MFRRGGPILIALALLAAPATASASSVTFGADLTLEPTGGSTCSALPSEPCSLLTTTHFSGAAETGSPMDGVLVSARIKTIGPATTVAIRVLRAGMTANTYLNVGPEISVAVPTQGGLTGIVTEATGLHHRILTGDRLGVGFLGGSLLVGVSGGPAQCGYRQGAGNDHPVDEERTYNTVGCNVDVLVQGTVESDADGDGFGDETQDQCPTNGSTQGSCPVAAPAPTPAPAPTRRKKCKKKHRSADAVTAKKRCKKKRG